MFDETRVYAGGYHFLGEDSFESVTGPRGRVEWRAYDLPVLGPGSRFMMGVEAQWDEPRGSQAFGLASLRIPFDVFSDKSKRKQLTGLDRRMLQPVIRDVDVVTSTQDITEILPALNQAGQAYTKVVEVEAADEAAVQAVLDDPANQADPTLIIPKNNGGMITLANPLTLNTNQTLGGVGGNGLLTVGYQSAFLPPGSVGHTPAGAATGFLADIGFPANNGLIAMAPDTELNGLTLDANDNATNGLRLDTAGTRNVANATIQNAQHTGVEVQAGILDIRNSSVSGNGGPGIELMNSSSLTLSDSEIFNNTGLNISMINDSTATIMGTRIYGSATASGILLIDASSLTLSDSEVFNNFGDNVRMHNLSTATITGTRLYGAVNGFGIEVNGNSSLTLSDSEVFGNAQANIKLVNAAEADITRTRIYGSVTAAGISVRDSASLTLSESEIFNNFGDNVRMIALSTATITGTRLYGAVTGSGIEFLSGSSTLLTLTDSEVFGNAQANILLGNTAVTDITGTRIYGSVTGSGIELGGSSSLTLSDSEVSGNAQNGIGNFGTGGVSVDEKSQVIDNELEEYCTNSGVISVGGEDIMAPPCIF